jgi:tripartite-type tricarboxylate transporter receptor subunit TctC
VVTKPGGAQTIGGYAVATAKPDGYTLGIFTAASSIPEVFTYFYEAPYSSKDLRSICRILEPVPVIAVKGDAPWNTLKDFLEYTRKNPGMKWGTHGKTSLGYLTMVTLNKSEKINLVHVPLEGDSKIVPAILGGHIPAGTPIYPAIKSLLDAKKLKALAFCLEKRVDFAPEVPTVVELGYKLAYVSHFGLFGPKGIPDEVVRKIDEASRKISEEQDFKSKISALGAQARYEATASFEKSMTLYREGLHSFFKEEGLVK